MIEWVFFPKSSPPPDFGVQIAAVFESAGAAIDSRVSSKASNEVLALLRPGLEGIGFQVEKGKAAADTINVPVLFGRNGKVAKTFKADAYAALGWVLEVEAGRAVVNNQFLKDIFQACMMQNVHYLALAVRNSYLGSADFATVETFLETLYVSGRLQLPLKGIFLIGY